LRDAGGARSFLTVTAGAPIHLPKGEAHAELVLENGTAHELKDGAAIHTPGYHRLRVADREITLAVAPPRCVTLDDIAPGAKLYGLAVQLYGLRRRDDLGTGDAG